MCMLVADKPTEYAQGLVPFSFQNKQAARNAAKKFEEGSVWILKRPSFDMNVKTHWNGCPVKVPVLLNSPTVLTRIGPDSSA